MYEIHFTDKTGIKDLYKKCDVRMTIVVQHLKNKKIVEKVLCDGIDVTAAALHEMPDELRRI